MRLKEYPPLQRTMLMMPLWRTPLLPPGWGLSRPSRAGIGASTAARAAACGAGMLACGGAPICGAADRILFSWRIFCCFVQERSVARRGGPAAAAAPDRPRSSSC